MVSKPAVYVHFSQLVMARRAAKELHEGMDVEFSVEPNPKRPGRMWATHVTLPGGDRIPGAWCSSSCVHARVRARESEGSRWYAFQGLLSSRTSVTQRAS